MNIKNLRKEINENKQLLTAMGIYINELEDRLKKNGYMSERIMQLRTKHNLQNENNQYMQIAYSYHTNFDLLMSVIAFYYKESPEEIKGKCRKQRFVVPRHMFSYLVKQYMPNMVLTDIGSYLGGRDHSSVIHGQQSIETFLGFDKKTKRDYAAIVQLLNEIASNNNNISYLETNAYLEAV